MQLRNIFGLIWHSKKGLFWLIGFMKRRHHPLISYIIRFCTSNIFLNSNMYVTAWLDKIMINLKTHICMHTKVNEASQKMSREQQINPYITLEDWLQMDYFSSKRIISIIFRTHVCIALCICLYVLRHENNLGLFNIWRFST